MSFLIERMPGINSARWIDDKAMNLRLNQLLDESKIRQQALPSNLNYGTAIYERGAVELISQDVSQVEAWVGGLDGTVKEGGGSRRRTQLSVKDGKLAWHCTGNPKNHDIFCKHCVALALTIIRAN
jgi:uncharacterized Zn finger protein